jgi:hypothetical protein
MARNPFDFLDDEEKKDLPQTPDPISPPPDDQTFDDQTFDDQTLNPFDFLDKPADSQFKKFTPRDTEDATSISAAPPVQPSGRPGFEDTMNVIAAGIRKENVFQDFVEQSGFDLGESPPFNFSVLIGLAPTPENEAQALDLYRTAAGIVFRRDMRGYIGVDKRTRIPFLIDPEDNKKIAINVPNRFEVTDIARNAPVIVIQTGAIATGLATFTAAIASGVGLGATPLSIVVESAAIGIGEFTRLAAGKKAGLHNMLFEDMARAALRDAGLVMAFGGGGAAIMGAFKLIGKLFGLSPPKVLDDPEAIEAFLKELTESQNEINVINKATGRMPAGQGGAMVTAGRASSSKDVQDVEGWLRGDPTYAGIFRKADEEFDAAMSDYFSKTFGVNVGKLDPLATPAARQDAVEGAIETAAARRRGDQAQLDRSIATAEKELKVAQKEIKGQVGVRQVTSVEGKSILYAVELARKRSRSTLQRQGDLYDGIVEGRLDKLGFTDTAGVRHPATIATFEFEKALGKLNVQNRENLVRGVQGIKDQPFDDVIDTLMNLPGGRGATTRRSATITWAEANRTLSALKALDRKLAQGAGAAETATKTTRGQVRTMIAALKADRMRLLNRDPALANATRLFERAVAKQKRLYERGVIADILGEGDAAIQPAEIFNKLFVQGSESDLATVSSVLMKNIGAGDTERRIKGIAVKYIRRGIMDDYDNFVRVTAKDGAVTDDVAKHARWMRNNQGKVKQFFDADEVGKIAKLGGLRAVVMKATKLRDDATKFMAKEFDEKIITTDIDDIYKKFWAFNQPGKSKKFMVWLQKNGTKRDVENFKATLSEQLFMDVSRTAPGGTRVMDLTKFRKLVDNPEKIATISAIFGKKHMANVRILHRALEKGKKSIDSFEPADITQKILVGLARANFGLFTKPGRFLTAFTLVRGLSAKRVLTEAMLDPKAMARLIDASKATITSPAGVAFLTEAGAYSMLHPDPAKPAPQFTKIQEAFTAGRLQSL